MPCSIKEDVERDVMAFRYGDGYGVQSDACTLPVRTCLRLMGHRVQGGTQAQVHVQACGAAYRGTPTAYTWTCARLRAHANTGTRIDTGYSVPWPLAHLQTALELSNHAFCVCVVNRRAPQRLGHNAAQMSERRTPCPCRAPSPLTQATTTAAKQRLRIAAGPTDMRSSLKAHGPAVAVCCNAMGADLDLVPRGAPAAQRSYRYRYRYRPTTGDRAAAVARRNGIRLAGSRRPASRATPRRDAQELGRVLRQHCTPAGYALGGQVHRALPVPTRARPAVRWQLLHWQLLVAALGLARRGPAALPCIAAALVVSVFASMPRWIPSRRSLAPCVRPRLDVIRGWEALGGRVRVGLLTPALVRALRLQPLLLLGLLLAAFP